MGRPLDERMAERQRKWEERMSQREETPSVTTGKPTPREDVKEGQQLWVTIVRGPLVRKMDDDWQMFHLATLVTQAQPDKGGVSIVSATLSDPMDRLDVEEEFRKYTADNIFPSEHEW